MTTERIYVYEADDRPGLVKVGQTNTGNSQKRVRQQATGAAANLRLIWESHRSHADGKSVFSDRDIHRRLKKAGIKCFVREDGRDTEWFYTNLTTVQAAVEAERQRAPYQSRYTRNKNFGLRNEQKEAIIKTQSEFRQAEKDGRCGHMLWNAKMRFGKTITTYQLARAENHKRILVTTFLPAVGGSWEEDLESHVDFEGWRFARTSDTDLADALNHDGPLVVFGSLQDLLGKKTSGEGENEAREIKEKNRALHTLAWDLVVLDEYHFGAWREGARELFGIDTPEAPENVEEEELPIQGKHYLYLSGTAFRAMESGNFTEAQMFHWTYPDEQRAKEKWATEHPESPRHENPYDSLPAMHTMTYRLDESMLQAAPDEDGGFDINAFFGAKVEQDGKAYFNNEAHVQTWLRQISGRRTEDRAIGGDRAVWPFAPGANVIFGDLRHTAWFLPSVAACKAMERLLKMDSHFGRDYTVVTVAGPEAGLGEAALPPVKNAIGENPHCTRTITLTCGKLMTGVTVPEWTGIFMLRSISTPETFFQAAFRVQSPWVGQAYGENGVVPVVRKRHVYVFDFAPQRALRLLADFASRSSGGSNVEKQTTELLEVWPVLTWDGNRMAEISAKDLLDLAMTGTSATLLAKRWESAMLVNLNNDVLKRVLNDNNLLSAIHAINGHRRLNASRNDLTFLINTQEAISELKKKKAIKESEGGALSKRDKASLSEKEREFRKKRDEVQQKLIKFSTRLPLFMYLSDHREMALNDVIRNIEPALFQSVTGLTVDQFDNLVEIGLFNREMMNSAVYHFKRYEDSSLDYIQLPGRTQALNSSNMGLFFTSMKRNEAQVTYGE